MANNWQVPPPTFDIETWASNYDGTLLPFRLAHVAQRCPSLAQQSLTHALALAKSGKNVQLYTLLQQLAVQLGQQGIEELDSDWIARQDESNKREQQRLEGELRGYKNNLIRESIRMGQEDLASHHLTTGGPPVDSSNPQSQNTTGLNAAYQAFGKMRDYCTTPTHIASMTLHMAYTALVQAVSAQALGSSASLHLGSLLANASRLRSVGVKDEEQVKLTPVATAMTGLSQLASGSYREAALAFIQTPFQYHTLGPVHGTDYSRTVASGNDIAIYGGLCALATFSREDIMTKVLKGTFRQYLELEPHMRKALSLFTTAKYQACIAILRHYYSDWSLDIFLGVNTVHGQSGAVSHVDRLMAKIREKSITAHFSAFSEATLSSLAATFPPDAFAPPSIEDEVLGMIQTGLLDARLDAVNGVIIAPQEDLRQKTHEDARATADELERTLRLRLHKVNMTLAGLEVPRPKGAVNGAWNTGETMT